MTLLPSFYSTAKVRARAKQAQRGVIVFIALIAVLVLSLAAVALLRSTDTAGVISGNVAFKSATTSAADTGAERAFNALPALATADADVANKYFRLMQAVDANGIPTAVANNDWTGVPCYDTAGGAAPISCEDESSYRVQYVIDRLCTTAPATTDPLTLLTSKCVAGQPFSSGGSAGDDLNSHAQTTNVFGSLTPPPPTRPTIHYRVTVRVQGPRNALSIVQTTIELPFG
ncbi:pilus assembly PilX family protein [Variovorax paradoxus]|uniref:pilus assembly PilX family protein n=1 Tax=Variovorax paradoxus TaxID=34073 RepID=UPI003ECEFCB3